MTANASSSSATRRRDAAPAPVPPLVAAWREGRDADLLDPVRFVPGDALPDLDPPAVDRREIAEALRRANAGYGHPTGEAMAAKLADPATRVVVAGQQPGLFGGPLYTLLKMIGAARWAAAWEAAGQAAVAVFWIATEDHDWDEVATTAVWTREGVERFDLGPDEDPLVPVGMRTLGPRVSAILDELRELFSYEPYLPWIDEMARWYRPDARFGEAFARLATAVLGERCPLLLDSMLPALKAAEAPWLGRLVSERRRVDQALAEADAGIRERGYDLQVHPAPETAPMFLFGGGERRRPTWEGDGAFGLRGVDAEPRPVAELLEIVADNPASVSPNVLSRPVVQDAILGTSLQVLGPGELSYFPQAAPLYRLLGVEAPAVTLRPRALLVESRHLEVLDDLDLPTAALLEDEDDLDARLAAREDADFVGPTRERVVAALDDLRGRALELDPNLERPWEKTKDHVLRGLGTFEDKVTKAAAHRDEINRRRLDTLRGFCAPAGVLHERVLSVAHFRGRFGPSLGECLYEELELGEEGVQIVTDPGEAGE